MQGHGDAGGSRTHTCGIHSRKPVDEFTLAEADDSGETGELFGGITGFSLLSKTPSRGC
jgi:hypothetical protein